MQKIIVPTDFSESSANALRYAEKLADTLGAAIKVVHFCHPTIDSTPAYTANTIDELLKARKAMLDNFIFKRKQESVEGILVKSLIDQDVIVGFASEELVKLSKTEEVSMIIMGTTGQGGVMENLIGSVSTATSKKAECPVWLVPPQCTFKGINNILYASNYDSADDAMMQKIMDMADQFQANIHMVHVNEASNKGDFQFEELILEEIFRRKAPSLEFRMTTVQSDTVWEGLFQYADRNTIDLIAMVTRRRKFWENFTHKSKTKASILNARHPLLIYHI